MTAERTIEGMVGGQTVASEKGLATLVVGSIPQCRDTITHNVEQGFLSRIWIKSNPIRFHLHHTSIQDSIVHRKYNAVAPAEPPLIPPRPERRGFSEVF